MKSKTLIFSVVVLAVVFVLSFAGCATADQQLDASIEKESNETREALDSQPSDATNEKDEKAQESFADGTPYESGSLTFEEFCLGMKANLSQEVMEELRALYEQFMEAEKNNDADKIMELYETLVDMDVMSEEENSKY